jgi:G3E family GTPase
VNAARSSGARPIPLTVIGGFLGAGKTTLVNAVLAHADGRQLAILVNDFGALSIDAALISARNAHTIALTNGCVCCTLVNGLVQALLDVLSLDPPPDHVLVEASGVSDPRAISQVARADRSFAQDATLVIVAADQIEGLARDRYVADTVLRQLTGADLVVLNKVDLVGRAEADATCAWLHALVPRARVLRAVDALVPTDLVLGPMPLERRNGTPEGGHPRSDHATTFATRTLRSARPVPETGLRQALASLPDAVLRAKGFVRFDTAPNTLQLIQVVGRRQTVAPAPPGVESTESVLVLVGAAEALAHADLVALMTHFA